MLIAFEGPDVQGRASSVANLGHLVGGSASSMTRQSYAEASALTSFEKGLVHTFDGVDWLTSMTQRLALPGGTKWDTIAVESFAAPGTHLVFKLRNQTEVNLIDDAYYHVADMITSLNEAKNFSLFKTVTCLRPVGLGQHSVVSFSSPLYLMGTVATRLVRDDNGLLELFHHEESNR